MKKTQAIPLRGTTLSASQKGVKLAKQEREKADADKTLERTAEIGDAKTELDLFVVGPVDAKLVHFFI